MSRSSVTDSDADLGSASEDNIPTVPQEHIVTPAGIMYPIYPVGVAMSDGVLQVSVRHKKKTRLQDNAPSATEGGESSTSAGFPRLLTEDDKKAVTWRRRLGTYLAHTIGNEDQKSKQWILEALPANYRLFELLRADGETIDVYLYGYPEGPPKRYRSPAEFLPHLIYLATDRDGDSRNCRCKFCCPENLQPLYEEAIRNIEARMAASDLKPKDETSTKKEGAASNTADSKSTSAAKEDKPSHKRMNSTAKEEPVHTAGQITPTTTTINTKPMVMVPGPSVPQELSTRSASKAPAQKVLMSTPLPPPQCAEQYHDTQEKTFIFRLGELVWFERGTAFGLSIVLQRFVVRDQRNQDHARYQVQPLSHPFGHPPVVDIDHQSRLKPWLVFSAPPATNEALQAPGLTFERIDWRATIAGRFGAGDAEIDGSIFAARVIDASYTPFHTLYVSSTTPTETHYNGMYFGGEKIWLGDAVRLREGPDNVQKVMVLHAIIEASTPRITTPIVHVVGDVYTFVTSTIPPDGQIPTNPRLPFRVQTDLGYRNRLSARANGQICSWKLVEVKSRLGLSDVKGRWYEASALLPILLDQAQYAKAVADADIPEIGGRLNSRGTGTLSEGQQGNRKADRVETFGAAVPSTTRISRDPQDEQPIVLDPALMGPIAGPVQPQPQQAQQPQGSHAGETDDAVEQFMNLDRMEDGSDQQYLAHGGRL